MPILATCPGCRSTLSVPDALAGKKCRCGLCQSVVPVPESPMPDVIPLEEAPPGPATCRACGGELSTADQACQYCGKTRLAAAADQPRNPEQWDLRVGGGPTALAPPEELPAPAAQPPTRQPSAQATGIKPEDWTLPEDTLAPLPREPAIPLPPHRPSANSPAAQPTDPASHITWSNRAAGPPPIPSALPARAAVPPARRTARRDPEEGSGNATLMWILGGIGALVLLLLVGVVGIFAFARSALEPEPPLAVMEVPKGVDNPPPFQNEAIPPQPVKGPPPVFVPVNPPLPKVDVPAVEKPAPPPANLALPPLPEPVPIAPAPVKAAMTVNLPETVTSLAAGGGGRFLALAMPGVLKVGVFDVSQAKFSQYIPLKHDDVRLAAGMTRLVIYYPATGDLERWNLLTGQCERQGKLDAAGKLMAFCMGSASDGPLLVCGTDRLRLLDLETFARLDIPQKGGGMARPDGGFYWAGASGRIVGHTGNHGQPNGVSAFVLDSQGLAGHYEHWGTWYVVPGPDGKHIYAGGHGVLTDKVGAAPDAVYSGTNNSGHCDYMFLPAHHGPFYLHMHVKSGLRGVATQAISSGDPDHGVTVYLLGHKRPIAQLSGVGNATYGEMASVRDLGIENTVHLVPRAKLLVVLPASRDRLLLHPLDVEAALDKSGVNYLVVTSAPPAVARRGRTLAYTVAAKAKTGGVTCNLESGPTGMTVSPQGQLRWNVPAGHPEGETSVIIGLRDNSGQQILHSFRLTVRAP